jgi:class 3 adenylate cyclase
MALSDDLTTYVKTTFDAQWAPAREGKVVPDQKSLSLTNDAIHFACATVLYADLNRSTKMVDSKQWWFAAEIYKTFLYCAARIIRDNGGEVVAYDGDRVMGVFLGDQQVRNAAICGLKINYAVTHLIMPLKKQKYTDDDFVLRHVVGIDASEMHVAKTGVRGDNDLVWVGRAANYAAKLSDINGDQATWITGAVFNALPETAKYGGNPSQLMWTKHTWNTMNKMEIYGSTWWWQV